MAEYIEREALKEHLKSYVGMFTDELGFAVSLEAVLGGIDFQPAADVVEVVHGDWEKQSGIYSCSVCGKACPYHTEDGVIWYWHCEFCPHCGAKMDGE